MNSNIDILDHFLIKLRMEQMRKVKNIDLVIL